MCYFMLKLDKIPERTLTLKEIFQRNGYPKSFIDKFYKKFLDRLHIIKPTLPRVEEKAFTLSITLFGADFFTSHDQDKKYYEKHSKLLKTSSYL